MLQKLLSSLPPPLGRCAVHRGRRFHQRVYAGSTRACRARAERTVILVEPNEAGGWTTTGPAETKALADLFDPEAEAEKRERLRAQIEENKVDLSAAGLPTDKLAARARLPIQVVEAEVKAYAKANPGLVAKRLDGRLVLFREGSVARVPRRFRRCSNAVDRTHESLVRTQG